MQKDILSVILILLHLCFVTDVTGQSSKQSFEIQPLKSEVLPDRSLERAILKTLPGYKPASEDEYIRYYYTRLDLNGDGQPEVLVYLVGSYSCGSGGCTMQIFQTESNVYHLVSTITLVQTPMFISEQKNAGWNNLLIYVSGGGAPAHYALLKFNGKRYPGNPTVQAAYKGKPDGKVFLKEELTPGTGITLRP